jgi:carbon monoxide dehydrogenase subunit G
MQIHASNDFAADPDAVFAMLTDRVFLRANVLATEPVEHEVSVDGLTTTTRRVMPSPSVVARFTGPTLAIIDEIRWEPSAGPVRTGQATITVEGMPAGLTGTVRLTPGGRGTLLDYDGELSVDIPILGPSLAKQAAPVLLDALAVQQQVGDAFLAKAEAE